MSQGETSNQKDQPQQPAKEERKIALPGSSGILIPADRTMKQPVLAYCSNPDCRENGKEFEFITENDLFACPKCGCNQGPMVGVKVLIHLMVKKQNGPIIGSNGIRYQIACDTKRAYLATLTNLEAATGDPSVANCPDCLANSQGKQGIELVAVKT